MNDQPTLAFLIPFASRQVKSDWQTACAHLQQTLRSIRNSVNGDYRAVVAGHERPDFNLGFGSRFHFLSVKACPVPSHQHDHVSLVRDKLRKIAAAWEYAKSAWNPKYVMKLDADDLISSRLVQWLHAADGAAGYLISRGWVWRPGSRYLIQQTEYFDRTCGSCLIIRSDVADKIGPFLTESEGYCLDEVNSRFAATDHYSLVPGSGSSSLLLNDSSTRYVAQFAYLGQKLSTVPFRAAVYRTGNPDSLEGRLRLIAPPIQTLRMVVGRIRRTKFITASLRREFMLG
jgi:exopolysaccharide biosynthesis galactosyltransferase PssJ